MKFSISVRRVVASLALISLVTARMIVPALAQAPSTAGSGLQISPTRHEVSVQPGEDKTVTVSLKNVSGAKIIAKAIINDFVADNDTGTPQLITDTQKTSASSIKKLITNLQDVPLNKDEVKDVPVTISIPVSASPGAYYGVLRYQAVPVDGGDSGNVSLTASVGTIMLIEVPGEIRESMEILSVRAERKGKASSFFTNVPDKLGIQVKNTGNSFLKPFGRVSISKGGKEVQNYELNNTDPRGNVLPSSTRTFRDELKNISSLGKYTATANIGFGNGGEVITISSTFWVVPLWLIVAVASFVLLLVVSVLFISFKMRRQRRGFRRR